MSDMLAQLRQQLFEPFPLHVHLGLEVFEDEGALGVLLPDTGPTQNHLGSQAAASLFAAADAASGVALVAAIGTSVNPLVAVVMEASMRFRRPAVGAIAARGRLVQPVSGLVSDLACDGRSNADVNVDLVDADGTRVAAVDVSWRLMRDAAGMAPLWRHS